jgi:hypothetical protein
MTSAEGEIIMTIKTRDRRIRLGLCLALGAILLIGNLQTHAEALDNSNLARIRGTGFWSDPCTQDGFAFGAGTVLCGTGSAGGCVTAFIGLIKAWKIDHCF